MSDALPIVLCSALTELKMAHVFSRQTGDIVRCNYAVARIRFQPWREKRQIDYNYHLMQFRKLTCKYDKPIVQDEKMGMPAILIP